MKAYIGNNKPEHQNTEAPPTALHDYCIYFNNFLVAKQSKYATRVHNETISSHTTPCFTFFLFFNPRD